MSIEKEIGKGVIFNILSKYSNVLIQIVLMIALSRMLSPEVFGEMALILTFLVFFNYFGNIGIGAAIIQKDNLSKDEIQDAFSFTVLLGIFLTGMYIFFSDFLSNYYSSNIFVNTKLIVSIIVFFNCLNTVPNSILRKNKNFKIMSINEIIANICSAVLAIILAFMRLGIYAIIFQNLSRIVILTILNLFFSKILINFKSKLNFSFLRKIYGYSIFEFLTNLLNYLSRSADTILVGKYLGIDILGYYDRSYRLLLFPIKNFTQLLTPTLHPIFAIYKNDRDKMFKYYIKISKLVILIALPISTFIYFNSELIIRIIYGDNWIKSSIYLKILSLSLIPQMLNGVFQAFYLSTDNSKKLFLNNMISNLILVGGIAIGIYKNSLLMVVYNITLGYFFKFFLDIFILNTIVFNIKNRIFFREIKSAIYIFIIIIFSQLKNLDKIENYYINFIFKGTILFIFYMVALKITGELKYFKFLRRKKC